MEDKNQTSWTDFILVGFSDLPNLRVFLFVVFLIIYLVTLSGNILVISVIYSDPHLHTPMYFFLTNLSFVDISYTLIMFPRMLVSFFLQDISIMLWECLLQVYFFAAFVSTEFFLLTIMAFDRYAAICNPLRYTMIMKKSLCLCMASGAWVCGLLVPISHTLQISKFSFCKTRELNHFFCDILALLNLSCTDTHSIETFTYILGVIIPIFSFFIIVTSYVNIISTIMRMQSVEGRQKAFSTCASHLAVVILFYGVLLFAYMRPASMYSVYQSKISSLAYIAVSPMCNPIIYTLKNKEFNNSFQRRKRSRILVCCRNGKLQMLAMKKKMQLREIGDAKMQLQEE